MWCSIIVYLDDGYPFQCQHYAANHFSHMDQESTSMTDQELELMGAGSSISPIARRARRTLEDRQTPRINTHNKYDLSRAGKRKLLKLNLLHLEEVVRFFFLNLGCQHRRVARCMSTRVLEGEDYYSVGEPCGRCPVCDDSRSKMHLPIYKSQLIRFFEPSAGRRSFLFDYSHKSVFCFLFE